MTQNKVLVPSSTFLFLRKVILLGQNIFFDKIIFLGFNAILIPLFSKPIFLSSYLKTQ